jgi:hypothetical protein
MKARAVNDHVETRCLRLEWDRDGTKLVLRQPKAGERASKQAMLLISLLPSTRVTDEPLSILRSSQVGNREATRSLGVSCTWIWYDYYLANMWNVGGKYCLYVFRSQKHDGFLHHNRVSIPNEFPMASILQFLSPRASKILVPTCTFTQSTSSVTASSRADDDSFIQRSESMIVIPYLQNDDSNQRTRNQFRPRNTTKGTTSYQLRQYAEATLGGGSLRKIVKLPEGEDENEWLAVNSM